VHVRIVLPAKCDLPVVRMAAQSFYRRLLNAGVELYEYQPQILHAKLFIIDGAAYVGSANLDVRSFNINYEVMVRLTNPAEVAEARKIFAEILEHSARIELDAWAKGRTIWQRIQSRIARFLLTRVDTFFARRQLRWWRLGLGKLKAAKKHKTFLTTKDTKTRREEI
jgi:cardiolipin synthase